MKVRVFKMMVSGKQTNLTNRRAMIEAGTYFTSDYVATKYALQVFKEGKCVVNSLHKTKADALAAAKAVK